MQFSISGICLLLSLLATSSSAPLEDKEAKGLSGEQPVLSADEPVQIPSGDQHFSKSDGNRNAQKITFTEKDARVHDEPNLIPAESTVVSSRKVVKTAENGQDYEYEYLYYYDDPENETALGIKDDLLLDLTKPSGLPLNSVNSNSVTDTVQAAFSETTRTEIRPTEPAPIEEEVQKELEALRVTAAATTTVAPTTAVSRKTPEQTNDSTDVRKTRPTSNSNRIRSKPSSSSVTKEAQVEKETSTASQTKPKATSSRGRNRFTVSVDLKTPTESPNESSRSVQPTRTSQSRGRTRASARTEETSAAGIEPSIRGKERKTATVGSDNRAAKAISRSKTAEQTVETPSSTPKVSLTANDDTTTVKSVSTLDFEAEIKVSDEFEALSEKQAKSLNGEILTGQDEAAAVAVQADAAEAKKEKAEGHTVVAADMPKSDVEQTTDAIVEVDPKVEEATETLKGVTETNTVEVVNNVPVSDEKSKVEPAPIPVPQEAPVAVKKEELNAPVNKVQEEAKVVKPETPTGRRRSQSNQHRSLTVDRAFRVSDGTEKDAKPVEESTTTTTQAPNKSLFNRARPSRFGLGSSKDAKKTIDPVVNSVTEETTTTTTTASKAVTRRPFLGSPLRRTSTATAEPVATTTSTAAPAEEATTSTANSRARGRQRFNVNRGFRVADTPSSESPVQADSVVGTPAQPVAESTSPLPVKAASPTQRARPNILLRSRTTTTPATAAETAEVSSNSATTEVETTPAAKETVRPKKPLKPVNDEASSEAPTTPSPSNARLNLLRNRPALVVSERPKAARSEVNAVDRKNRFSSILKKPGNQPESPKAETENGAEETAAEKQDAVEIPTPVEETKPVEEAPVVQNRLRGNRRPGQLATTRKVAEVQ